VPSLKIKVEGDTSTLGNSLGQAGGKVEAFGKSLDIGMLAKGAGVVGVAVTVGKALLDMGEAASQDRLEQDQLTAAIVAATGSQADHTAEIDKAIAAGQDKAFTDTQTREALTSLVTTTHDVTAATGLLSTAQDVARFANVDLATAADAVAKANAGQDGALRKLMPGLEKGSSATATLAAATKAAAGQADVYAKSGPGMGAKVSDSMSELGETIGTAVLPILDALMPALLAIIKAFSTLVTALLPYLIPMFKFLGQWIGIFADAVAKAIGFISTLVGWLSKALGMIGDLLKGIGNIHLPFGIGGTSAGTASGTGLSATTQAGSTYAGGGFVVNVYGGDPAQVQAMVVGALRRYTSRNGNAGLYGTGLAQGGA
jgi:hypothetical protein